MQNRKLFLIPVGLAAENSGDWVGAHLRNAVLPLRRFVVEHPKSARQFLKTLGLPLQELEFEVLDEHSKAHDLDRLEAPADVIILSACSTATISAQSGGAPLGLSSVLLARGTRSLVVANSPLPDEAIVPMMERFHTRLRAGSLYGERT